MNEKEHDHLLRLSFGKQITMSVPNKTALVTGSTSGIGLACARALAKRGVNVVITGFGDENVISGIVEELKGYGVCANYLPADLTKVTDIENLWSGVLRLYPDGIDILVNNAGIFRVNAIENTPDTEWDEQIAVILSAAFHFTKRCLPSMQKKGWGRIINTSSKVGVVGFPNLAAYVAAKHALIGLTKGVALENAARGITCNAICPGVVATPMTRNFNEQKATALGTTVEKIDELARASQLTGSIIQPEQVAELVEFLCLSNASSQMTGAAYLIDCGWTAQ